MHAGLFVAILGVSLHVGLASALVGKLDPCAVPGKLSKVLSPDCMSWPGNG